MSDLSRDFPRYLARTSEDPPDLDVDRAEGAWLVAADGRRYLDWLAGIGVNNLGHRHPAVLQAIQTQLERHLHVMVYGEYAQEVQVSLAREINNLAPVRDARTYFTSTGTESIEGALKLARKKTGRTKFVAFEGGYHGTTAGSLSLMGRKELREPFEPLLATQHLPFGDSQALSRIDEDTAAVVIEPIQAEGGVRVPPDDFLLRLRRRCDETGALLIFDEIQTGLGRTGRLWGLDHWGVMPDVLVLAKALGGGLPLGAFIAPADLMERLARDPALSHLTTFGGHPLSCAAGLAALSVTMEQNLAGAAARAGEEIFLALADLKARGQIEDVRGKGLLIGVALKSTEKAREAEGKCRAAGLLVGRALNDEKVLRLTPPLNMTAEELLSGTRILSRSLSG